jgi:glycosyltransferase involved in cell wall biosynthesis
MMSTQQSRGTPDQGQPDARKQRVAYLVNQYPKVSHTFIRREILALERLGGQVERFALRGWQDLLPDGADQVEQARTRYLLRRGVLPLFGAGLATALRQPRQALRSLRGVMQRARFSQRPWPIHLIYFLEACLLARWLREARVSHLHAHFGTNSSEVALVAAELGGLPFSFTVHGPEEFDRPEALALGAKAEAAAFVATVSEFGRSQMMRWTSASAWDRLQVVRCGLEAAFFPDIATLPPDNLQLVCVGRLCEQKGQLVLIDALARLLRSGVAARLVLAGDGELRGAIEARIQQRGIRDAVEITGWISSDRVAELILASRALVLPSFAEGLPVVLMEALALGRPVVSTYVAGIPELVEPGRSGWLVPAGDVESLTAAMRQVLSTPLADLADMGRHGQLRVRELHSVDGQAALLARHFANSMEAQSTAAQQPAVAASPRLSGVA